MFKLDAEARKFSEGPPRNMVWEKLSVGPEITYYDASVIVKNRTAAAENWQADEKLPRCDHVWHDEHS